MKNTTKSQMGPPASAGSIEGGQRGHLAASLDRPETASMGPSGVDEPSANLPERVFLIEFSAQLVDLRDPLQRRITDRLWNLILLGCRIDDG
jgi:hypothetical protein